MAGDTMRFRNPAGHAGLLHNLLALVNDLAGFSGEPARPFREGVQDGARAGSGARWPASLARWCSSLFGYVFLLASAIAGIAHALHFSWIWITLVAAGLHFVLALVCVLIARSRMNKPMFAATVAELKKDREWLKNLDKKNRSTN